MNLLPSRRYGPSDKQASARFPTKVHAMPICGPALLQHDPATLLRLLVLAPVLEEFLIRAGLQDWLGRGYRAGVLAALAFAALHLPQGWVAAAWTLPMGMVLSGLYARRRRWQECALAHAASNGAALAACAWISF